MRSSFSTASESSRDMEAESGGRGDWSNMRTGETELQTVMAGEVRFHFCAARKWPVAVSTFRGRIRGSGGCKKD